MRRLALLTLAAAAIVSTDARRSEATEVGASRNFGLGFQIGEPTAITAKAFVGGAHAFDFGLGFGGWGYDWCRDANGNSYRCGNINHNFSFHMDYLYQENIVNRTNRLDWYVGFGGRLITSAYGSNEPCLSGCLPRTASGAEVPSHLGCNLKHSVALVQSWTCGPATQAAFGNQPDKHGTNLATTSSFLPAFRLESQPCFGAPTSWKPTLKLRPPS